MEFQTINPGCSMMVNNIEEENLLLSSLRSDMRVLEFGMGLSTIAIARKVRQVVSIEYDQQFYNDFRRQYTLAPNISVFLSVPNVMPSGIEDGTYEQFKNYIEAPLQTIQHEKFDLVFIDGRARVQCALFTAQHYLKPGGVIFIHDYLHPTAAYRRPEYEVVENFLEVTDQAFAMAKFRVKKNPVYRINMQPSETIGSSSTIQSDASMQPESSGDRTTCWYDHNVVDEMNRFYDRHIHNQNIRFHMQAFTDLLFFINPTNAKELLDLGCGTAMLSEFCQDFDYSGADLPHVIAGCAIRNYPNYFYRSCDFVEQEIDWIKKFSIVVLNGVIDVMEKPLETLAKILKSTSLYLIIHRQEITEEGDTRVVKNPSYGSQTYHSIINRKTFCDMMEASGFEILAETRCGFGNWENGGSSFLLIKKI